MGVGVHKNGGRREEMTYSYEFLQEKAVYSLKLMVDNKDKEEAGKYLEASRAYAALADLQRLKDASERGSR